MYSRISSVHFCFATPSSKLCLKCRGLKRLQFDQKSSLSHAPERCQGGLNSCIQLIEQITSDKTKFHLAYEWHIVKGQGIQGIMASESCGVKCTQSGSRVANDQDTYEVLPV